ncbi:MAG TPA: hypothetical protein VGB24_01590 [Longimicrobium sp.]|jgi:hypothetical protein|uniref:hypothetical protein n=1 Tax=Longimicrobium sp. TaxID=2029185 RepID=UPI002EDA9D31
MTSLRKRAVHGAVLASTVLGFTACSDAGAPLATETTPAATSTAPTTPANERLARLVALAARDASVRGLLHRSFAASNEREGKLLLDAYLRAEGAPLLRAMSRATGMGQDEILALLDETGPMEMYLPVEAHRAAWRGGDDLVVATLMLDHTVPAGFDLAGRPVQLSKDAAPSVPAISIVPAEGFDEAGAPNHTRTGQPRSYAGVRFHHTTVGTPWTGLWVNEVHTSSDFEGWALGNAEFELYLQDANTREILVCAEAGSIEPYRWDLNGDNYSSPFLIAAEGEVPEGVVRTVALYEDDDGRCVIRDEKDYWKLAADGLTSTYSAYKAIKDRQFQNGEWVMHLSNAYMSFKSIASGNDEFVGVSAGVDDVGSTARTMWLKDSNGNNQGSLVLQYKTDVAH